MLLGWQGLCVVGVPAGFPRSGRGAPIERRSHPSVRRGRGQAPSLWTGRPALHTADRVSRSVPRGTSNQVGRVSAGTGPGNHCTDATGRIWNDGGDHCSEQRLVPSAAADRLPRIGGRPARPRTGATSEGRCVRWAPLPGHVLGQRPVVGERWAVTSVRDRYPIARPSAGRQTSTGRQCAEVMPSGRPRSCRLTAGGRLHPQPGDLVRFSVAARWTRVAVVQSSAVPRGTSWSRCSPGRTTRCHLGISRRGPW